MIANEQQRVIVSRQLGELEAWRDRVLHDTTQSPFQTRVEAAGIEKMIARLQEEIEAYESAKAGQIPPVVTAHVQDDSFAEIASTLVRLRLAGDVRIVAVDNGDQISHAPFQADRVQLFNGKALVIIRAGARAGAATLTAEAQGFAPASVRVVMQ